jgi:hypothetical protein
MFMLLTIVTVWSILLFEWNAINHPFHPGDFTVLSPVILSPFTLGLSVFWLLFIFVELAFLSARHLPVGRLRRYGGAIVYISRRRAASWMHALDFPLLAGGIGLGAYGWIAGQLAPLVMGTLLTIGLLLHAGEQWLRAYSS